MVDSESTIDSVQGLPGILGLEMKNVGCKQKTKGVTLSDNDPQSFAHSRIYRSKLNA